MLLINIEAKKKLKLIDLFGKGLGISSLLEN